MPLDLNYEPESERSQCVLWNPDNVQEASEAEVLMERYYKLGYKLASFDRGEAIFVPPKPNKNTIIFRVLSKNGDDRLLWDRRDLEQVREAKSKFKEYVDSYHTPYACKKDGTKGSKLDSFDQTHEEIIFVPKTMPG